MLAVRTPGASQAARFSAGCDSAFPFERQGRLLRSRSISGLCSRSLHSGLQPPCLRFATAVTGRHARLSSRLLARLCRGRHRRRQTSTRLQGATLTDPDLTLSRHPARATARRLPPSVENWSSSCCQLACSQRRWPAPFAPRALSRFNTTTGQSAPLRRISTFGLAVGAACAFSLGMPARFSRSVQEPD